jgi:hypothetical protein
MVFFYNCCNLRYFVKFRKIKAVKRVSFFKFRECIRETGLDGKGRREE